MKILAVSDSHNGYTFGGFFDKTKNADIVVHLGDGDRDKADLAAVLMHKRAEHLTVLTDRFLPDTAAGVGSLMHNIPFYALRGNCDFSGLPEVIFQAGNFNVLALHGDRFFVKSDLSYLRRYAENKNADIVLYGHSHIPSIDWLDGRLFVNPGSLCRPRDGYKPTYCVIDIDGDKIYPELKEYK